MSVVHYFGKHMSEEQVQDALMRYEDLVKRAAELLRAVHSGAGDFEDWDTKCDQWLNDAEGK